MSSPLLRTAAVLGLLGAVGPFAIDMYLPAMPAIAEGLGTSIVATQGTLTAYFVAFGLAQLVYGPWADAAGRKPPLLFGLALFVLGSVGCAVAPDIATLTAMRALQAAGGAAVMVIPRAIIRDLHTGPEATRLMALVMLVISVSPMLAPLAGSGLLATADWRAIFWALVAAGALSIAVTLLLQPETLPRSARTPVQVRALLRGARVLMTDPMFLGLTFLGGFGMASFFVFIAQASFVYTGQFGLTPTGFSLAFAVNALGFFAATQLAAPLGMRLGAARVIRRASLGFAAVTLALFGLATLGAASLGVIVAGLFLANACLGLIIPTTMVMALDAHGRIAGLASSLGGTLQMLTGGVMIALTGLVFDGTALPMLGAIALCGLAVAVQARMTLARGGPLAPAV
jgi:DHA1 family bicyclomycin/chloramphenicol resistance-like MFS transporter